MKLPITFETFKELSNYYLSELKDDEPSCFNGRVRVRKVRITIEEIEESDDVIAARIQALWDKCDNHHHWMPLKAAAEEVGLKLTH